MIASGEVYAGELPTRALRLVRKWLEQHATRSCATVSVASLVNLRRRLLRLLIRVSRVQDPRGPSAARAADDRVARVEGVARRLEVLGCGSVGAQ